MTSAAFDLSFVRRQFPALDGPTLFFDNAGGSQILQRVVDRISEYLLTSNVQPGASYAVSQLASQRLSGGVAAAAQLLGTADPTEVVLGSSSTQLLANLALAFAQQLQPGDEIVVTNADHEANIGPWLALQARGALVRVWRVRPDTGRLELEDLAALLGPRTRLVCVTQASNILGTIQPVPQIARLVHEHGAEICVDGVAYAAHRAVDVRAWDIDYYVFSFYKVFGPHNAVLWGRRDSLLQLGGINFEFIGKEAVPLKLQPGKFNFELAWSLTGIVDYLEELGRRLEPALDSPRAALELAFERIAIHEELLARPLLDFLGSRPGVRVLGEPSADRQLRLPIVSFVVEGRSSSTVPPHLDRLGIGVRYGHFYSKRLIDDLGLAAHDGVVRISVAHYNTAQEVEALIRGLARALDAA